MVEAFIRVQGRHRGALSSARMGDPATRATRSGARDPALAGGAERLSRAPWPGLA